MTSSGRRYCARRTSPQRRIGIEDADDPHIRARLGGAQKARDVAVHESGDREPQRRGRRLLLRLRGQQRGEDTRDPQRRKQQSLHRAILSGMTAGEEQA